MKSLIERYGLSIVASYAAAAAGFGYSLIFSMAYGAEFYSTVAIAIASAAFGQIIVNFGSDKRQAKEYIAAGEAWKEIAFVALAFRGLIFVIIVCGLLLVFKLNRFELVFFVWYTMNALYPKALAEYKGEITKQSLSYAAEKFSSLIVIAAWVFLSAEPSLIMMAVLCLLRLAFVVFQYFLLVGWTETWLERSKITQAAKSYISDFFQNCGVVIALLMNAILVYGAQLYLKEFVDAATVAKVGLAVQLCLIVQIFQSQIVRFLHKDIFSKGRNITLAMLNRRLMVYTCPTLVLIVMMNVAALLLEMYVLPPSFAGLIGIINLLSVWLLVLAPGMIISQVFLAIFNAKYYMGISACAGIMSLLVMSMVIPEFKEYGYIFQLVFVHSVSMLAQYLFVIKGIKVETV